MTIWTKPISRPFPPTRGCSVARVVGVLQGLVLATDAEVFRWTP
ncbi:hypothetical protein [Streptomyces sp. SYP-A7193]|nr:hypothetical protein [Streptomyces sp. SYP-A7193]